MKIVEYTKDRQEEFDRFVVRQSIGDLLQSWAWGDLQRKEGRRVNRFGVKRDGKLVATFQLMEMDLPLGRKYLYVPRGPVLDYDDSDLLGYLLEEVLVELAHRKGVDFVRVDPKVDLGSKESAKTVASLLDEGYVRTSGEMQPKDTMVVDIGGPEEEVMAAMKSKWRYNIRLAGRKEVKVEMLEGGAGVAEFYQLMEKTTGRDGFAAHSKEHYENLLRMPKGTAAVFQAKYRSIVIASIIVSFYKDTATYLHGASDYYHRKLMAPHLLQWEAMREAKRRGCTRYDLYGVAPEGEKDHAWAGITRFKEGFGGMRVSYIGQFERAISGFWYSMYKFGKKLRK